MRRLHLKKISVEQQMTVVLPVIVGLLLMVALITVSHARQRDHVTVGDPVQKSHAAADLPSLPLLCMLDFDDVRYCVAVNMRPSTGTVVISTLPATDTHRTAAVAAQETTALTAVAFRHYVCLTVPQLQNMLQYYGQGVTVQLDDMLQYRDENGLTVVFPAGKIHLYAQQAADLLSAASANDRAEMVGKLIGGMLQAYMTPDRSWQSDYEKLAGMAQTDMRIYDFQACRPTLETLAALSPVVKWVDAFPKTGAAGERETWKRLFEE